MPPQQTVDLLLTHAIVLTMDADFHIYEPGAIAVRGNTIVAVGPEAEITAAYTAAEIHDCGGKVLSPGLINAHTHVPMTLLRGLADDLRLDVWLLGYIMPVEREFVSPEFVYLGTKIATAELIRSGVTAFADMYYFEEEVAKATAEAGLRALAGETILKFPSPDARSYEEGLEYARDFIARWKDHPLVVPAIAPHAPYTVTDEMWHAATRLALEYDVPIHTHLAETAQEVEDMREAHDMPVIPYVKKQGVFEAKVLAAHCVHIDTGEMHTLKHWGVGVAHNPSSNLKLADGIAPVAKMLELGLNVGIGTDGPASNNDLDMFEEVRLAALLAKGATGDPTVLPAKQAWAMATRLGAQALHMGEFTGSLEPGKRADFILIDISPVHNAPRFRRDPEGIYAQLVYAAKSTDVTDVMVDGKWLMRNRELLTVNEAELLAQADDYAHKVDAFLIHREQSVLSKLVAIEAASEAESFEVQLKVKIDDPARLAEAVEQAEGLEILYRRHYREYDVYFAFDDPQQGYLRYREDEFVEPDGSISRVRYRLTLIGPAHEDAFPGAVLLSRSRYLASATHSLRFYREYFQPAAERVVEKDRLRWKVRFQETEFFINIDDVQKPPLGAFLEIKSRAWSRRDAERKATLAADLLRLLGLADAQPVEEDYIALTDDQPTR